MRKYHMIIVNNKNVMSRVIYNSMIKLTAKIASNVVEKVHTARAYLMVDFVKAAKSRSIRRPRLLMLTQILNLHM